MPKPIRTKEDWTRVIDGKTPSAIAHFITPDLIGYRSTSLRRTDDEDSLTNLIHVLLERAP